MKNSGAVVEKIDPDTWPDRFFLNGWRPYLWLAAAAFLLYFRSLSFGYTYLDDNVLIMGNQAFLKDITNLPQAFFRKIFQGSFLPYYRPMLTASLMIDTMIGGGGPFVYHFTNIFIHAAASSLVFVFLARLGYERARSFAASLVFTVHPVLAQAAAWIPGRNDSLLALFVLASFIFFIDFIRSGAWSRYTWHVILFMLAMYTKESAIVLVPLCFLYLHLIAKEKLFSPHEKAIAPAWFAVIMLWSWTRAVALSGATEVTVFDMGSLIMIYMPAAVQFTGKIFFPFNLSVFPIIQDTSFIFGTVALILLAAAMILTKNRRYNYLAFGIAWILLFMAPSLIRANYRISADFLEHRVYVTIIGFIIIFFETGFGRMLCANKRALAAVTIFIMVMFSAIALNHSDNFRDRASFWNDAVRTSPHSPFAHLARGQEYYDNEKLDDAEREFKTCLELDPLKAGALYHLGKVYFKKGMFDKAETEYRKAIAVYPYYDGAYLELGVACYKQGKNSLAEQAWRKALKINPRDVNAHKFLAIYFYEQKDFAGSMSHVRELQKMGLEVPAEFLSSLKAKLEGGT